MHLALKEVANKQSLKNGASNQELPLGCNHELPLGCTWFAPCQMPQEQLQTNLLWLPHRMHLFFQGCMVHTRSMAGFVSLVLPGWLVQSF